MMPTPSLVAAALLAAGQAWASAGLRPRTSECADAAAGTTARITPKVMIVSMFYPEADVWYENLPSSGYGDLFANNISVPGLSPIYPEVHCTASGDICQLTMGEGEINAATSITALVLSDQFNLTSTYFLLNGIAGVSPKMATLGSVSLSKYTVSVALQYEFDAREKPANFSTGYLGYGTTLPGQYPANQYGTEVFELNEALRDRAYGFAKAANLSDNAGSAAYRARYAAAGQSFAAATVGPGVVRCDTATSDVYYSGTLLAEAFENTTMLWTNQTEMTYCMSAQEDSAVMNGLLRGHLSGAVDYSRAILVRTASDFDRPPPGVSDYDHLLIVDQGGYEIAVENIYLAGIEIVKGILTGWNCTFGAGVKPFNYIGDIFGTLGGEPDFGPGSVFTGSAGAEDDGSTYTGSVKKRGVREVADRKALARRGRRAGWGRAGR